MRADSLIERISQLEGQRADLLDALSRFVAIRDWAHDECHSARLEYDAPADAARETISKANNAGKGVGE